MRYGRVEDEGRYDEGDEEEEEDKFVRWEEMVEESKISKESRKVR